MDTNIVTIPARPQHEGFLVAIVKVKWKCPVCGSERGDVYKTRSHDGSRILDCDGWKNPCGHVDKYEDVVAEAMANGLNKKPNNYCKRNASLN